MKKFLLILLVSLPISIKAQEFYQPSDIDVMWRVWNEEWTFNWLIENGQKISPSVNPSIEYRGLYFDTPTEICLSFLKDNKFLCLTFSKAEGIRLFTESRVYNVADTYSAVNSLIAQPWFNIDFEHIVYNEVLGWILIPCGYNEYSGWNAIAISFGESGVYTPPFIQDDEEIKYYNIQGISIERPNKGQITVKRGGTKTEKILIK